MMPRSIASIIRLLLENVYNCTGEIFGKQVSYLLINTIMNHQRNKNVFHYTAVIAELLLSLT